MAQASAPIQGMDYHLLNSALLYFGVTPAGAHEFMQGLPVSSQADRNALQTMVLGLAKRPDLRFAGGKEPKIGVPEGPVTSGTATKGISQASGVVSA